MHTLKTQLRLLAAFRAIRMFLLTMPVVAIYWQQHGLTMQDMFVLQVIYSIVVVVMEMPSGYFADRFGNKTSLLCGGITATLGFFMYWVWPSYWGFVCAETMLAVSGGLISGSREALLFDSLRAHNVNTDNEYTRYLGRHFSYSQISEATAAVLAGFIVAVSSISMILLLQCLVMLISIPVALALNPHKTNGKKPESILRILQFCFYSNRRLRWFNLFTGSMAACTLAMVWFTQPYWRESGVPIEYFGIMWASLNLMVALGSILSHRIKKRIPVRILFGCIAFIPLVLYWTNAILAGTFIGVGFVAMFWFVRGVANPVISTYVQQESTDENRATILSANALMIRVIFSVFAPFLGWITDTWSFATAFAASGLIFGSISIIGFVCWITVINKE